MKLHVTTGDMLGLETDALLVNLFEGLDRPGGATAAVDNRLEGLISQLMDGREITGKRGELTEIHTLGRIAPKRVIVVGLGKQEELDGDTVRYAMGEAVRFLRAKGVVSAHTIAHGAGTGGLSPEQSARAIAEGSLLGLYEFTRHKRQRDGQPAFTDLTLVEQDSARVAPLELGLSTGTATADAVILCRDLSNEPSNHLTPARLAQAAHDLADEVGLECTVLEKSDMEHMGMGALLGVAKGSTEPPKLVVLRYWGDPAHEENNIALVGKGITFDSGGISIKAAAGMGAMKGDMAGAASVIGAMQAIARLKPQINVTALAPCTENMPGGHAQKPGDVVRAMDGTTIEIENTDAEGRLVLADALAYARQMGQRRLVDVATLTGAIRVALGTVGAGVFGNDQNLVDRLLDASRQAGEKLWQLPLWEEYKQQLQSDVADLKNTGGQPAGSGTAARFLQEFAQDTPWAHLDIAATARTDTTKGYTLKGATGFSVRTLIALVQDLASPS